MSEVPASTSICCRIIPARYCMALLGSMGMAIVYGLKVNLSVTMVAMLNHTAIKGEAGVGENVTVEKDPEECDPPGGASSVAEKIEDGPFVWSEPLQGVILSCYFWGYIVGMIPLARIAELFSAKWVMLVSVAIIVLCTLATPVLTKLHYIGLIVMRMMEGLGGGASFPAMHVMIANWSPPSERLLISSITYAGTSAGTAISIVLSGVTAAQLGWEAVFYSQGLLCLIWMALWIILVQDIPNKQRFMSPEERSYINDSLGTQTHVAPPPVPWAKVAKCCPFWALLIAHTCSNWGWYMFLIEIPFYMKQVLKFNVASNAALSAIPYIPSLLFTILTGQVLGLLRKKEKISTTAARKIATVLASLLPALCLLVLCYIGCLHYVAVGFMWGGITTMGAMFVGFLSNHIDLAPNFAGTLVALTNTSATLSGIIVPLFVGFVTEGNQNIHAWRIIFGVTIILFIIEIVVYTIFGSGKEQSWNSAEGQ